MSNPGQMKSCWPRNALSPSGRPRKGTSDLAQDLVPPGALCLVAQKSRRRHHRRCRRQLPPNPRTHPGQRQREVRQGLHVPRPQAPAGRWWSTRRNFSGSCRLRASSTQRRCVRASCVPRYAQRDIHKRTPSLFLVGGRLWQHLRSSVTRRQLECSTLLAHHDCR